MGEPHENDTEHSQSVEYPGGEAEIVDEGGEVAGKHVDAGEEGEEYYCDRGGLAVHVAEGQDRHQVTFTGGRES